MALHGRGTSELFPPPLVVITFLLVPPWFFMGWRIACVEKLGRARDQEVIDETLALLAGKNVPIDYFLD